MLKCRDISLHASDYLEKQLPAGQRLGFALHLLMCGRCREFIRQMEKAITVFQELPAGEMDQVEAEELAGSVIARAEGSKGSE